MINFLDKPKGELESLQTKKNTDSNNDIWLKSIKVVNDGNKVKLLYCRSLRFGYFVELAQAALRAPTEVALAMRSWPLLLPSFSLSFSLSFSVFCC